MKDLKYYVLWRKDSPLLKEYKERFYQKLIQDLQKLADNGTLKTEIEELLWSENRDFILNPDISSLINGLSIEWLPVYEEKLQNEIHFYLIGESEKLTMNKWKKIAGTDIRLTIEDNNPYNQNEAHPEHRLTWWVIWWWEKSEEEWLKVYIKTFELLKMLYEGIYDELNQIIKKIIPLWTAESLHNSASYKECIGHLYMWYTTGSDKPEINNLEAIIHESSHNKLNLIMQFDPIVVNDKTEKYYSAIRPDARHIHGVLLWIHAFVPTIYMLIKAYKSGMLWNDQHWLDKIVLYYMKNKFMYKVMTKYAKFTPLWQEIFDEIVYVIWLSDKLFKELNPSKESIMRAKERQTEHFMQVNKHYPHLEY